MKKIAMMAVAAAALLMGACTGAPTAKMNSDVDTFCYAFGMSQADGLKMYMTQRLGIDTAYVDDFLAGLLEGTKAAKDTSAMARVAGMQLGQQIATQWVNGLNFDITGNDSTQVVSLDNLLAGFFAGAKGDNKIMETSGATELAQKMMQQFADQRIEKEFGANKMENEGFMESIARKDGIKSLGNGVYYEVLTEGTGAVPSDTSAVTIAYRGTLFDGTEFDKSPEDKPYESRANQFIPGFTAALTAMPAGSKWKVYIPQEQAYGSRQMGAIKPFSALVFELELISVK